MTHSLLGNYDVFKHMDVFRPVASTQHDMSIFHADDYIEFLTRVTPDNQMEFVTQLKRFNLGEDCPVMDGLFDYCATYTGGSVNGAVRLNYDKADVAINWSGGLHHAKKSEASGFCFVNDIVLSILELLKHHQRVLYVDIDIHHGDGVEEAFYCTDRVMTASFHKYGDGFFPGTGHMADNGSGTAKNYSINVPLRDGVNDDTYWQLFEPVMTKLLARFQPGAIVVCAGADSISGDRLGCFNLSLSGHSRCIELLQRYGAKLLLLGGGGYTLRNVARCWAYETSRVLDVNLPEELPEKDRFIQYYGPTFEMAHKQCNNMRNLNDDEYVQKVLTHCLQVLDELPAAPSVQAHHVPPDYKPPEVDEDAKDPDVRRSQEEIEQRRVYDSALADDSDDEDGRRHSGRAPRAVKKEEGGAAGGAAGGADAPVAVQQEQPGGGEGDGAAAAEGGADAQAPADAAAVKQEPAGGEAVQE